MDEVQDVNATPSTAQEVVKESVETTEQATTPVEDVQQPVESATPEAVKDEGEVDEKGVPYKNRFMEAQRKLASIQQEYTGLQSSLPKMLEDAVAKAIPQKEATPSYSKEELIKFKNTSDDPNHRAWAEIELEKIRSKETEEYFRNQSQKKDKELATEQAKQQALGYVMNNYGVMFNPDGSWNNSHPLTQKLARIYNSDETLKNHPFGLRVAADMAVAEHIREVQPEIVKQTTKLKRKVKKLEQKTLIEGNGQPHSVRVVDPLKSAFERLEKTGDKNATKAVAAELIKRVHAGLV